MGELGELGELDVNEFYDVYRTFKPDATREEFQKDWDEFQAAKSARISKKPQQ